MSEDGVILPVKAQPGARKSGIMGVHDGALKVAVNQAPEKGKATAAIIKLLAEVLGIKKCQIQLLTGQTSVQKRFLLSGLNSADIVSRIILLAKSVNSVESEENEHRGEITGSKY